MDPGLRPRHLGPAGIADVQAGKVHQHLAVLAGESALELQVELALQARCAAVQVQHAVAHQRRQRWLARQRDEAGPAVVTRRRQRDAHRGRPLQHQHVPHAAGQRLRAGVVQRVRHGPFARPARPVQPAADLQAGDRTHRAFQVDAHRRVVAPGRRDAPGAAVQVAVRRALRPGRFRRHPGLAAAPERKVPIPAQRGPAGLVAVEGLAFQPGVDKAQLMRALLQPHQPAADGGHQAQGDVVLAQHMGRPALEGLQRQ